MSQYHQLGVAVPGLENNTSFQFGKSFSTTLSVSSTRYPNSGFPRLYTYYQNPYLPQILRRGDRVVIGPSTYTNYEGAKESAVIKDLASYYIELTTALQNYYNVDDEVNGVGSMLASGWEIQGNNSLAFTPSNLWYPYLPSSNHTDRTGLFHFHNSVYNDTDWQNYFGGSTNRFRQFIRWDSANGTGAGSNTASLKRSYGNTLLGNTYYRFGIYTKGSSSGEIYAKVNDGSSDFITGFSIASDSASAWTEKTSTGISASAPSDCIIYIYRNSGSTTISYMIDDIYLEHAKYTDGNTAGVYTFTEVPNLDSEKIEKIQETEFQIDRSQAGRGYKYQLSGTADKVEKYRLSMEFSVVDPQFYNNLKVLFDWQKYGYNLIFHSNDYLKSQMKPVMYCIMSITNIRWEMWDRTRPSFTLTFEEI